MTGKTIEGLPEITITAIIIIDDKKGNDLCYSLVNDKGAVVPISHHQFNAIGQFSDHPNELVPTSSFRTANESTYVSREQYVAETMYRLSQEDLLGNLLRPETYGPHIVGYRLAAIVNVCLGYVDQVEMRNRQLSI